MSHQSYLASFPFSYLWPCLPPGPFFTETSSFAANIIQHEERAKYYP